VRPFDALTLEAGARYDHVSYTGDSYVSPRTNLSWQPASATTIRAAWGIHGQSDPISALQVQNGVREFQRAERAKQIGLGIDQLASAGVMLHVEAYDRWISPLRARFINSTTRIY